MTVGPPMSPEEEAQHRAGYLAQIADEVEQAVATITAQLEGWKAALTAKKAEAKAARAAATAAAKEV